MTARYVPKVGDTVAIRTGIIGLAQGTVTRVTGRYADVGGAGGSRRFSLVTLKETGARRYSRDSVEPWGPRHDDLAELDRLVRGLSAMIADAASRPLWGVPLPELRHATATAASLLAILDVGAVEAEEP